MTVLVGENSTGKSTVLAVAHLAARLASGDLDLDFNEPPFLMGAYDQIVSSPPRETRFTIGGIFDVGKRQRATVWGEFVKESGHPQISRWCMKCESLEVVYEFGKRRGAVHRAASLILRSKDTYAEVGELRLDIDPMFRPNQFLPIIHVVREWSRGGFLKTEGDLPAEKDFKELQRIWNKVIQAAGSPTFPFSPMRTSPKRTYDSMKGGRNPEGSHVPMVLASLSRGANRAKWDFLRDEIASFGEASGLFRSVSIRSLGDDDETDPFQLTIQISDRVSFNLADVGYGVSQVLPIVVDCIDGVVGSSYLLQQPEVHLHPRAQAQLATFLAFLARERNKRFVIETHSDYFVDRLRMDVRDGTGLNANEVRIVFLERQGDEVIVHPMAIDPKGDFVGRPDCYRQFFMEEEMRFLNVKSPSQS